MGLTRCRFTQDDAVANGLHIALRHPARQTVRAEITVGEGRVDGAEEVDGGCGGGGGAGSGAGGGAGGGAGDGGTGEGCGGSGGRSGSDSSGRVAG